MQVLVVEDDREVGALLEQVLSEGGHQSRLCATVATAEHALSATSFDVLILDWMLPDGDGLELCTRLRQRHNSTPVLFLTARGELQDRVRGLRHGADDYLVKPFEVDELLARVEALHRRAQRGSTLKIGPLELDRETQAVSVDGSRVGLTAREFAILNRLAQSKGQAVSREGLLRDVWQLTFDPGSGLIDVHISRLRDKLGSAAPMIETVRGRGYRLKFDG
jgi:DNA-binding response OmpR family regulator